MKLVIPSAKIVPEGLQSLGKLPAIIYPLGQGIVFDYLLDQYRNEVDETVILCYEMADEVRRRLENSLSEKVKLKKLAQLGDLGNSIYEGLDESHSPVIINFADTIVLDQFCEEDGDSFFCSEDYPSDVWTFFEESNGVITSINDKKSGQDERTPQKLFVGVFQIMDQTDLKVCLKEAFLKADGEMSSFYYALREYSKKHPMKVLRTDNWFDLGHADKYYDSKLEVKAREFNHITIDKYRGILRKTSDNKEKFIGEILWYLKLPSDVEYIRPRIFSYSTNYTNPFVEMEYYSYHTVHELFLYGDLNYHQWIDIFKRIKFIYRDFQRYQVTGARIREALEEMYLKKTLERLQKLSVEEAFLPFFDNPIEINQMKYLSLRDISKRLEKMIPQLLYDVDAFHIIHGDLCFANIMIDSNFSFIKVIDPRGQFGSFDIYGDQRYELAKLFHSVDGKYDFIIKDLFWLKVELKLAKIEYCIQERDRGYDLYETFLDAFKEEIGEDLKKIELIEALLFLSMIPLHRESIEHQYVMLATGIEILDRAIGVRYEND